MRRVVAGAAAQAHEALPARISAANDRPWDSIRGSSSSAPSQDQGFPRHGHCVAGHGPLVHRAALSVKGEAILLFQPLWYLMSGQK